MARLLAGLDIGTSGCKLTAFTPEGMNLGRVYRDYPPSRRAAEHELEAAQIRKAVDEVLREAARRWPDIAAIGVTSFGESFVLLDKDDEPLAPIMLYTDMRGADECEAICRAIGREKIARITGINPHAMYGLPKLMWTKTHRPELYERAVRALQMGEYAAYLLTGTAQLDYTLATRTMAFDLRTLDYNEELLAAAGIQRDLFSPVVPTGTATGYIKPKLAAELGVSPDLLVVLAGQDQISAAVGSGVFAPGDAVDGAGTVECITPVFTGIPEHPVMREGGYAIVPYIEPERYVCYAFSFTGGAAVQWFCDQLAGHAKADAERDGMSLYASLEGPSQPEEPTGLLVLPHFAGAATPYMDSGSKAAIVGLTLATTQRELFRAVMEGVCYEMRLNMERLAEAGIHIARLRATGGGANSRIWLQMKADVLNRPVIALASAEAGGTGAAMLAGVAAGAFASLEEAASIMISERETFIPRAKLHKKYSAVYERYAKLYDAVRGIVG